MKSRSDASSTRICATAIDGYHTAGEAKLPHAVEAVKFSNVIREVLKLHEIEPTHYKLWSNEILIGDNGVVDRISDPLLHMYNKTLKTGVTETLLPVGWRSHPTGRRVSTDAPGRFGSVQGQECGDDDGYT